MLLNFKRYSPILKMSTVILCELKKCSWIKNSKRKKIQKWKMGKWWRKIIKNERKRPTTLHWASPKAPVCALWWTSTALHVEQENMRYTQEQLFNVTLHSGHTPGAEELLEHRHVSHVGRILQEHVFFFVSAHVFGFYLVNFFSSLWFLLGFL